MSRRNLMCLRVRGIDVLFNPAAVTVEFHEAGRCIAERRALLTLHGQTASLVMAGLWIAQRRQRAAEFLAMLFREPREAPRAWVSEMAAFYRCGDLVLRMPEP